VKNAELAAVLAELDAHGVQYEVRCGGKHLRVVWEIRQHRRRTTIVGHTSSDWRAVKNARAHVRRQLREEGVE
jgi:hypothetical protein